MFNERLYSEDVRVEINIESTAFYDKEFAYVTGIKQPNANLLIVKIRTRDKFVTTGLSETFGTYNGWCISMSTVLDINHDELPSDYCMNDIVIGTEGFNCDHVTTISMSNEIEVLMMRDTFNPEDEEVDYTVIDWNKNKDSSLNV